MLPFMTATLGLDPIAAKAGIEATQIPNLEEIGNKLALLPMDGYVDFLMPVNGRVKVL